MGNEIILEKITESNLIPEKVREAILNGDCKITSSLIAKAKIIPIYRIHRDGNRSDERYRKINLQIDKMLSDLVAYSKDFILIINILCPNHYLIAFASESVDHIFEILDFTGLGNTNDYLKSLFQ